MRYASLAALLGILVLIFFSNISGEVKNITAGLENDANSPFVKNIGNRRFLSAKLYSTYPFNHRNLAAINIGRSREIKEGMTVTIGGVSLLGKIIEIGDGYGIVRTIFDPNWSLPVRIGNDEIDALLVGGQRLRLTTIEKSRVVADGDIVYSTGRDFPYGLKIGFVKNIENLPAKTFQEADIDLDYKFNDLREAMVLLDYAGN